MENKEELNNAPEEKVEVEALETKVESEQQINKEEPEKRETLTLPENKEPNTVKVDGVEYPKDIVEKAKLQGWVEKSDMRQKKIYLSPEEFLKKGEENSAILNKKLKRMEEENSKMSKLLQKQLVEQSKDRLQDVNKQMKQAKDDFELDGYDDLVVKKIRLEQEISDYGKKPEEPAVQAQRVHPLIEDWNTKNLWSVHTLSDGTLNPDYDVRKTGEANNILRTIQTEQPHIDMVTALSLVDYNLQRKEGLAKQKANVTPPVATNSQAITPPVNKHTFDNLKPEMRRIFDKCNDDGSGSKFTGDALKKMKQSFLKDCEDEHFNF